MGSVRINRGYITIDPIHNGTFMILMRRPEERIYDPVVTSAIDIDRQNVKRD